MSSSRPHCNRLARFMRNRGWTRGRHEGGLLHRLHDILIRHARWYFDSQDGGSTILVGYWPGPGSDGNIRRTGLDGRAEQRLFLRWFVWDGFIKAEWFGLRRWLYFKALHNGLYAQRPFSCKVGIEDGGYAHWHCELHRRHDGQHRFRNYTWTAGERAQFDPIEVTR